ncbi:MAG: two-component regulator propeller domain-containing protein [Pseudomonadota bacterium]
MGNLRRHFFCLFFLYCAAISDALASSHSHKYLFSQSDLTSELSQVGVNTVYQDKDGFLWILTQEGLNRFDGDNNLVFRADVNDPRSLRNDHLTGVVEDEDNGLWFSTQGGGLNYFDRSSSSFTALLASEDLLRSPLSNSIRTISKASPTALWLGYTDGGVSLFDTKSKTFKHYVGGYRELARDIPVSSVVTGRNGVTYVATYGGGVLTLNVEQGSYKRYASTTEAFHTIGSDRIKSIYVDAEDSVFIGTLDSGLYKVSSNGKVVHFGFFRSDDSEIQTPLIGVNSIVETSDGDILIAAQSGVALVDSSLSSISQISIRGIDSRNLQINSITQDKSGLVWAGGYSGMYLGVESAISRIDKFAGLKSSNILSVASSADGHVFVGTSAGLVSFSDSYELAYAFGDFEQKPITALLPVNGRVWVGTFQSGLTYVDLVTERSESYGKGEGYDHPISDDQITSIYKDSFGNIWVGTFSGGVNVLFAGQSEFQSFMHNDDDPSTLGHNSVMAIYQERSGDLWLGTNKGLSRFDYDTRTFRNFAYEENLPGTLPQKTVFSIYEDQKARLWIGTNGGGLYMWEPVDRKMSRVKVRHFQSNIGLPSNNVYAIQGDDEGNIWLATSGGLTRYNHDLKDVKHFTADDGLQSNDLNFGASFRDQNGLLYFGGTSGLNIFDPKEMRKPAVPPKMALTRVSLGNEQIFFDKPYNDLDYIELQPDDYLFGLSFAALDFRAPERNQYRYQMVGLDKNWVELGNRNSIDFTKLPPGQFVLRVQGSNPDGVWSPEGLALRIKVNPPFYLTLWAFIAYFAAALLLLGLVVYRQRLKAREQLQYQTQLEGDVRARTLDLRRSNEKLQEAVEEMGKARQEAEQANQAKSEFLAALSHEIRTPMHGVLGMTDLLLHSGLSERQQNFAESAHVSANELLGLIDNILDFSKIEAGKLELEETTFNLREMVENLCYLYGELAQAKGLELNVIVKPRLDRQLYGDPVRLRQILQNLLSNAIKFTKRGSVNLIVRERMHWERHLDLEIQVEDTGIGMGEETVQRVFEAFSQADTSTTRQFGGTGLGLSIAKQLIDLMGGELDVTSRVGIGTSMSVALSFSESPIYAEQLAVGDLASCYAEVVAPVPETRAMFAGQLEALGLRVRDCTSVEELTAVAEQARVILIDVGSLYGAAEITQVANLSDDPLTTVMLVTPLSGVGVPDELVHIPHTMKPLRLNTLLGDLRTARSEGEESEQSFLPTLMRYEQRILLVEDIVANQEIAKAMLESFGCQVVIANQGEVAVEMFQRESFDLVLMDCQMPVMDGFEATRHIRRYEAQQNDGRRIPVVALTAGKTESEKERCYASGMDRILFKPYSTEELNSLLRNYFQPVGEVAPPQGDNAVKRELSDLLDAKALDNIRSIETSTGNALLETVVGNFRVDGERKLEELREAAGDANALSAGAHAIKSMSLNVGAKALSDHCRRCENQWKLGDITNADRDTEILAEHFNDAVDALESLLSSESLQLG